MVTNDVSIKGQVFLEIAFFQSPNWIFDEKTPLTEHEVIVFLFLCRCANNSDSRAFPSYKTIAEKCRISRRTAIRSIDGLTEKGFLIKQKRQYTSNVYILQKPDNTVFLEGGDCESPPSDSQSPPPGVTQSPPSDSQSPIKRTTEKEQYLKRNNNNNAVDFLDLINNVFNEFKIDQLVLNKKSKDALNILCHFDEFTLTTLAKRLSSLQTETDTHYKYFDNSLRAIIAQPDLIHKILNNEIKNRPKSNKSIASDTEYEIFIPPGSRN